MNILENIFQAVIGEKGIRFLDTQIVNTSLIYLDYWIFLHLSAGALFAYFYPERLKLWIGIMVALEVLELLMVGLHYKNHYVLTDSIWDLAVGLLGFILISKAGRLTVFGWFK